MTISLCLCIKMFADHCLKVINYCFHSCFAQKYSLEIILLYEWMEIFPCWSKWINWSKTKSNRLVRWYWVGSSLWIIVLHEPAGRLQRNRFIFYWIPQKVQKNIWFCWGLKWKNARRVGRKIEFLLKNDCFKIHSKW